MKINLLVEPNKQISDYSEMKAINNKVGRNISLTIEIMLKKAMKDFHSTSNETMPKFYQLLEILKNAKIKEIIATGLVEGTLNQDKWNSTSVNKVLTSVALIYKFESDEAKKLGLEKNSIILTCSSEVQKNVEYLVLKRVDFLNLPFAKVNNPFVHELPSDWELEIKVNQTFISASSNIVGTPFHDFWWDRSHQRLSSIFYDDKGELSADKHLHVNHWFNFLREFRGFLKNKQKNGASYAFTLENSEIEKNARIIIEIDDEVKKIYESDTPKLKFSLMTDPSIVFDATVTKSTEFDFVKYINEEIETFMVNKQNFDNEIISLNNDILVKKNLLAKQNETYKLSYDTRNRIQDEINEYKKVKLSFENEISNLKNSVKNFESEILKINNSKNKNIDLKLIEEKNERVNENKISIKEIELQVKSIEDKITDHESELRETENKIKNEEQELNVLNSSIRELNNQNASLEREIKNINDKIEVRKRTISQVKGNIYYECEIRIKEKELDEGFNFVPFDFEKFIKSNYDAANIFWKASTYDEGFARIYSRYYDGFANLRVGAYRNPYLVTALNNPSMFSTSMNNKNPNYKKYLPVKGLNLNEKQIDAVETALNTSSIAFLQGPPGTGKTQVISGLTTNLINKGENILISSSTHEAINNAFDRIHDISRDNPNVFFLKMLSGNRLKNKDVKDEELAYTEQKMRYNFYNAIDNFVIGDDGESDVLNNVNELLKLDNIELEKTINEIAFTKIIENNFGNVSNLKYLKKYYCEPGAESFFETNPSGYIQAIIYQTRDNQKVRMSNGEVGQKLNKLISEFSTQIKFEDDDFFDNKLLLEKIKSSLEKHSNSNILNKFKTLNKKFKDTYDDHKNLNRNFASEVFENELINVIGITTTANQQIMVDGEKKMLFSEYQIDYEIIDEVSKSSTAELINASILSGRVLYCGDYRQIQPQDDLANHILFKEWVEKNPVAYEKLDIKPEVLIKTPIFKILALQLVTASEKQIYRFLNVQHRFTENIMNVVNNIYMDSEQLEMPKVQKEFKKYNFSYNNTNFNEDTCIVDTTHMSLDDQNLFRSKGVQLTNDYSFDSKNSILIKSNRTFASRINEVDALAVLKIVESMLDSGIKSSDIGIITITRSQAQLIKSLARSLEVKHVKIIERMAIDTVDNFQGREKEIIIVDFVNGRNILSEDGKKVLTPTNRNDDHLRAVERLNVAISRARAKLIMVGSFEYYDAIDSKLDIGTTSETIYLFREWLEKVRNQGGLYKLWNEIN